MKSRILAIFTLLLALATSAAHAQTTITFPSGDQSAQGVLYPATTAGKHPALILIHEWWGLNDWVKQQAAGFQQQGYTVLAIDLYRGKSAGSDAEVAHELMRGLPQDQGVRDLKAAFNLLAARPEVDSTRIGVLGWCMGGGFAAQLAVAEPRLKAAVINYGALPTEPSALAGIHAAILGNFGALDQGIPPSAVEAFTKSMKQLGKSVDTKVYADAGHAFENPNNKAGYKPEDAADAESRANQFLSTQLK